MKFLVGIDEAGRGPLAGPVTVGVAVVPVDFDWKLLEGVGDSKTLSPKNREAIFRCASDLRRQGCIDFQVASSSQFIIDSQGIIFAVERAMERALTKLELNHQQCEVRLDGALRAPSKFLHQQTIIKGDATEPAIGLASILAKVTRDRYMTRLAKKPKLTPYQFDIHKGYGTKAHRELIQKHGLSDIHRRSFCRNIHTWKNLV